MIQFVVLALLLCILPSNLAGQVDSVLRVAVTTIHNRQLVRVRVWGGVTFFGRSLGLHGDSLVVTSPLPTGERAVHLDSVTHLWLQQGTHAINASK